jgi:opacity protein-like surface antigen
MNNKIIYLIFLVCVSSLPLNAQDEVSAGGLKFGVRVGGTVSTFSKAQPHASEKFGFMAGVSAEYLFSDNLSVALEPAYNQLGGQLVRFTDDTRFGDASIFANSVTSSKITLAYLDLPLLAKYRLKSFGNFRPNVVVGGSFAYLLDARDNLTKTYHYNQTFFTIREMRKVSSQYEPFQLDLTAGAGGEVSLGGSNRLLIDFRYRYGLTTAKKSYSYIDLESVQGDLYTNSFSFTLGFGF